MREILFRGKRMGNGEWVEGGYYKEDYSERVYILGFMDAYQVDPATVGQYTGLQDTNGKRIFEGDILKTHYANAKRSEFVEVVVFHNGRFCAEGNLGGGGRSWANLWDGVPHVPQDKMIYMDSMEVIGNIHDNPELMEVQHGRE